MRSSPPSSTSSSPSSETSSPAIEAADPPPRERTGPSARWAVLLFLASVVTITQTGVAYASEPGAKANLAGGVAYAAALLAILVSHESGHFFAAKLHRVPASLPLFIPLPAEISSFGTMGAVIVMRDRIRSRAALLDVGAAGPLAGLVVAIPVLLFGLARSPVHASPAHGAIEGQCLLYSLLKRVACGPIPDGYDVFLSPVAFAGWAGLLVTMLNLLPLGQLDGGHVAYALFGPRQNRFARAIRFAPLALVAYNALAHPPPPLATFSLDALSDPAWAPFLSSTTMWLVLFVLHRVLARFGGVDHPPTDDEVLGPGRKLVACATLAIFVLLFMPTPWLTY